MEGEDRIGRGGDLVWATGTGLAAFVAYLITLAPGMVAVVDTPMFQFVGRVLGVPHNPGYPVYVLLTHVFSYVPIGTLAYRINLFSALCGAASVALVCLAARQLGCRRSIAVTAALGVAFGQTFWSQAVIAEVYTLDTVFVAGAFLALFAFGRSAEPRLRLFFAAVGLLALGFGNRTTILALLPGLMLYAWFTHRTAVTRPRVVLVTLLLLSAALVPYGFILIRSHDPTAYLETRATTPGELFAAIGGEQWHDRVMTVGWSQVFTERIPWLHEYVLGPELTMAGLLLFVVGIGALIVGRRPEAWPLLSSWVAYVAFALSYDAIDLPVFLIPAVLVSWLVMAVGGEWLIARIRPSPVRRAATVLLLVMPVWLWWQNYESVDQSGNTAAARVFDRLFETLPDRAAIVREDYLIDRMVQYKVRGEPPAGGASVEALDQSDAIERARRGTAGLFAFPKAAAELRLAGVDVDYAPLPLGGARLPEFLARQPEGHIVAIAVPASLAEAFVTGGSSALAPIGAPGGLQTTDEGGLVVVGVTGAPAEAVRLRATDGGCLSYGAGQAIGETGRFAPAEFTLEASGFDAAIHLGGRNIVRSAEGAVAAMWDVDGQLIRTMVLQAADGFRVPMAPGPLSVYPVRGVHRALDVGPSWTHVNGAARSGSVLVRVGGPSTTDLLIASESPLFPRVFDRAPEDIVLSIDEADRADAAAAFGDSPGARAAYLYRASITGPGSATIALGGLPIDVVARVSGDGAAAVSSLAVDGLLRAVDRSTDVLRMARDDQSQLMGPGWSEVEADQAGPFRWTAARQATLLLPTRNAPLRRIRLHARVAPEVDLLGVRVILNGRDLGAHAAVPAWRTYEWQVPPGVEIVGTNSLVLTLDEAEMVAPLGLPRRWLAVSDLRLMRDGTPDSQAMASGVSAVTRPCS